MPALYSFDAFIGNFPLIMAFFAWFIAQFIKLVLTFFVCREELNAKILLSSGGMPSSHSSTVCALTTSIVLTHGWGSPLFAISAVLSFIVMYDAMGVRRSAGEQAQTLNQIILHLFDQKQIPIDTTVREIFGHTPFQVLVGALIGIAIPFIVRFGLGLY